MVSIKKKTSENKEQINQQEQSIINSAREFVTLFSNDKLKELDKNIIQILEYSGNTALAKTKIKFFANSTDTTSIKKITNKPDNSNYSTSIKKLPKNEGIRPLEFHFNPEDIEKLKKILKEMQIGSNESIEAIKDFDISKELKEKIQFKFDQSDFMDFFKEQLDSENVRTALSHFGGLCQGICSLIVVFGHNDERIQNMLSWCDNKEKNVSAIINELNKNAWANHLINLITDVEKTMALYLNVAPETLLSPSLQHSFFDKNTKTVNPDVLETVFNNSEYNFYIQFSGVEIVEINDKKDIPEFINGHAMLLFKTLEDGETKYCFFDPNEGLIKRNSVKELAGDMNKFLQAPGFNYNRAYLMDIEAILLRSRYCSRLIEERVTSEEKSFIPPTK